MARRVREAAAHGIAWGDELWAGVRVEAGEATTFVTPKVIEEIVVELRSGGSVFTGRSGGTIVGLDPVFRVHEYGTVDGRFTMHGTIPGRYFLVGSPGHFGTFEIPGSDPFVELGTAMLTVTAPAGARVELLPESADPLLRQMGWNVRAEVPDSGTLVLGPLLPPADFAVERVATRVAAGGRSVPEADIRRRFERGLRLFHTVYKALPDRWYHWHSDDIGLRLLHQHEK